MSDELVKKLKNQEVYVRVCGELWAKDFTYIEAAARITALEEENKRLREALKPFMYAGGQVPDGCEDRWPTQIAVRLGDLRRAAAALEKK